MIAVNRKEKLWKPVHFLPQLLYIPSYLDEELTNIVI